jgi:hypothetical protein
MLSIKEAAAKLSEWTQRVFPTATIRSWVMLGKLNVTKIGGRNFVKEEDLKKFLPET